MSQMSTSEKHFLKRKVSIYTILPLVEPDWLKKSVNQYSDHYVGHFHKDYGKIYLMKMYHSSTSTTATTFRLYTDKLKKQFPPPPPPYHL